MPKPPRIYIVAISIVLVLLLILIGVYIPIVRKGNLIVSQLYSSYLNDQIARHDAGLAAAQELGMPPESLISEKPMCLTTGCITYLFFATPMDEEQLRAQIRKSPYDFAYDQFRDYNIYTVPDIANHEVVFVVGQAPMPSPRQLDAYGLFPSPNAKPKHFIKPTLYPVAAVPDSYTYQGKPFRLNVVELYVSEPKSY